MMNDKKPAVGLSASNAGLGWQPIATAPKDETKFIILCEDGIKGIAYHKIMSEKCYLVCEFIIKSTPLFWMPNVELRGAALLRRPV